MCMKGETAFYPAQLERDPSRTDAPRMNDRIGLYDGNCRHATGNGSGRLEDETGSSVIDRHAFDPIPVYHRKNASVWLNATVSWNILSVSVGLTAGWRVGEIETVTTGPLTECVNYELAVLTFPTGNNRRKSNGLEMERLQK